MYYAMYILKYSYLRLVLILFTFRISFSHLNLCPWNIGKLLSGIKSVPPVYFQENVIRNNSFVALLHFGDTNAFILVLILVLIMWRFYLFSG